MPILGIFARFTAVGFSCLVGGSIVAYAMADEVPIDRRPVTVFFLRHAEKLVDGTSDPALSPVGRIRAEALVALLDGEPVTDLFSTEYKRTRQTLEPLAKRTNLEIQSISAREPNQQVEALRALGPGSFAVVAGHSNTIPALVAALGGSIDGLHPSPHGDVLSEATYDRVFRVTRSASSSDAETLELRFTVPIPSGSSFEVVFEEAVSKAPLDGRVLLMIAKTADAEPRFQINDGPKGQQIFGVTVEGLAADQPVRFSASVFGYPCASLKEVPAGEYWVQALLHRYETFHRSDGRVVKLPMDRGEGQHWNRAPGNLLSRPMRVRFDPKIKGVVRLSMDGSIPPIEPPKDTAFIKHVKIKSDLLTEFWGRPMELGACVLLPAGFDEHPEARYPLIVNHGHFPRTFTGFRETPPDPNLVPDYSERFQLDGYNRIQQEMAHDFYKQWTGPDMPRMVIIKVQHANPYYDDSYAVNSANLGPYGDAIMHELIPFVEERFRCLGEGWARFTYGGSTGGWEALAAQVFYPEEFNGCFAACPDPIDFRAYTVVNLYDDENAYYLKENWKRTPRSGMRDRLGHVSSTLEQMNHRELVLGTHSRSGDQWDIWEAVYSPAGEDGYPRRIWDKMTGEIDAEVATYWRENYDLRHILERDWKTLGPMLKGKIHVYCGTMDNYYLNNAVYLMEDFLKETRNPHYGGVVEYGDRAEHCWNGDHRRSNAISRLRYNVMYLDRIIARMEEFSPEGADLVSWRY